MTVFHVLRGSTSSGDDTIARWSKVLRLDFSLSSRLPDARVQILLLEKCEKLLPVTSVFYRALRFSSTESTTCTVNSEKIALVLRF